MLSFNYSIVDAFTQSPFKGNPAAVIVLAQDSQHSCSDSLLQAVAAEFNLSETAYATPIDQSNGSFHLRWFTPTSEVNLCGHATLATAHVLFSNRELFGLPNDLVRLQFHTKNSGTLTAKVLQDKRIELDFPAGQVSPIDSIIAQERISTAVSAAFDPYPPKIKFIGDGNGLSYDDYLFVEINSDYDLEGRSINADALKTLAPAHRVITVGQRVATEGSEDFKCRVFGPALGVQEDPVTGSAHSFMASYWHKVLGKSEGSELRGKQSSLRSGQVGTVIEGDRCKLRGYATLVAKGELFCP